MDNSTNRFDQYLAQIESRERTKRRRYQVAAAIAFFAVSGGIGWWIYQPSAPSALRQYNADNLNYTMVKDLFEKEEAQIVVAHPSIGYDTIYSPEDYLSLRGLLDQMEAKPYQEAESAGLEVPPTFAVDIAGSRVAGNQLTFTIEGYDESLTYLMDFGNGFRREIGKTASYSYGYSGNYRLRLIATNEQGSSSIYNKSLTIDRSPGDIAQQETPQPRVENVPVETQAPVAGASTEPSNNLTAMRGTSPLSTPIRTTTPDMRENIPSVQEGNSESAPINNSNEPLVVSEVEPAYPGGSSALGNFVRSNYRYPRSAQDANIEGSVYVQFVVNVDGTISNARIIKGIGGGCDEEALRLVNMMPKWIPGKQNGYPVSVYHTVPITFKLIR